MTASPLPPALPHGALTEPVPGLHFVTGAFAMPGMRFSRAMTVVREGTRLILVNSMRLDDAGLAALDALGTVTDVIRLAGFHGRDDRFYRERYDAKVWVARGQRYVKGFDQNAPSYFSPDHEYDATTTLPIAGAKLHIFSTVPPEAMLLLPHGGGTLITGDALQNWAKADEFFNLPARMVMRMMGFFQAHGVGPAWFKRAKPAAAEFAAVLDLPFVNLLPSHGAPVVGDAREKYRPAIERAIQARR